ncbi:MAG: hypothetical protein J6Y37_18560 [Paludibacteraceae bacterium]|nr:hypothetical protein [Paludibacteraceae bacterium]
MKKIGYEKFIVVAWWNGTPYILQMRGVLNWFFDNNSPKVFGTLQTAEKNARRICASYKNNCVKVYRIFSEKEVIGVDNLQKWESKEQSQRVAFSIEREKNK